MKKLLWMALVIFYIQSTAQEIPRFNPDTIKTIQLDSAVNITSERLMWRLLSGQ